MPVPLAPSLGGQPIRSNDVLRTATRNRVFVFIGTYPFV